MELVKLNTEQYGLQENKAKELESLYLPMLTMLSTMEKEFNELVNKEITNELEKDAKDLRIRISKVRINAEKAKATAKAEYLRAGNAIQGAYNTIRYAVESKELKLKEIENHSINLIKEQQAKLETERLIELKKYEPLTVSAGRLGMMDADVWENYINGVKLNFKQIREAEKKTELERIEKEAAEKARIKKIEVENKRLEKEAKKIEKERLKLALEQERINDERIKKEQAAEAERQRIVKIEADKLAKEKAERQKIADELEAKRVAEIKVKQEKEAAEKAHKLAPDKEKLIKLSNDLLNVFLPDLKADEAKEILKDVKILLNKISIHIKEKTKIL